jgi:hypothetical protein
MMNEQSFLKEQNENKAKQNKTKQQTEQEQEHKSITNGTDAIQIS